MSHEQVDLAIVGCGVSGSSVALAASKSDVSVRIFEEHATIGEPSHCSGHVGIEAFTRFASEIPRRIIENEIKGSMFYSPNGRSLTLRRAEPITWVLNRAELDKHLAKLAKKSGAELHVRSRVNGFKRSEKGKPTLRISGRRERQVECKVVIDAAGCGGSFSKYVGLPQPNPQMLVNSAQFSVQNVEDIDEDFVEVYFGQSYAPGFFGWIIPRRDGSAKVGLASAHRSNVRECFERFVRKHPIVSSKLRHAKILAPARFHPIPVGGGMSPTYADGVMTVGDAASQVKPTTGGGIVFGLACGRIAGEIASMAVKSGDASSSALSQYEREWRRMIGFDLAAMAWLRKMLYRLPDRNLNRIFDVSRELGADEVLNRTRDIDFQGRTILSLSRDPRLLITLLSASVLSAPSLMSLGVKGRSKRG